MELKLRPVKCCTVCTLSEAKNRYSTTRSCKYFAEHSSILICGVYKPRRDLLGGRFDGCRG
jgi:hypothetical protein